MGYQKSLSRRPKLPSSMDSDDPYLVIGIDFGTTFSGAAWGTKSDFDRGHQNVITTWPDVGGEEGKAPTELYYDVDSGLSWGFGIPYDGDPVRWFKLLLLKEEDIDPEIRRHEYAQSARRQLEENNKSATDLIADYLRELWKHILDSIMKTRSESVVEALPFHIVLTVPAIWKGYARQGMEKAAKRAGLLDRRPAGQTILSFAPEPEAAALSTLSDPDHMEMVKKDDVYLICDAGGGTVDLITYRIDSVGPICMHEAVEGTGGLCGGIFIDQAFEYMCRDRLGRKWTRLSKAGIKELLTSEWQQSIKPHFKPGDNNKEYIVRIPAEVFGKDSQDDFSKEPHIKKARIHFKSIHIQQAYTKVFGQIDKLIDEQIKKASHQSLSVRGIILVGGLGGSPYLYEHLKSRYSNKRIEILQSGGMKPRTAICRGAVLKGFLDGVARGLEGSTQKGGSIISITSTVARSSLGVLYDAVFDKQKHLEEDKIYDDDEGIWRASDQMKWYLRKGDNVSKMSPVSNTFHRTWERDPGKTFTVRIHSCEDAEPPKRFGSSVKLLCEIKCTFDIPFSSFRDHKRPDGRIIKRIDYEVRMIPSGASMEFAAYLEGRKLGQGNANVQFN